MPRPGPRMTKQSVIAHRRGSLGDSSDDESSVEDESNIGGSATSDGKENRTPQKQDTRRQSQLRVRPNESEFQTPENENDATDYGLEFTTSNIQHPSPRRCSTLKSVNSQEEQATSSEKTKPAKKQTTTKAVPKKPLVAAAANKEVAQKSATRNSGDESTGTDESSGDTAEEEQRHSLRNSKTDNVTPTTSKNPPATKTKKVTAKSKSKSAPVPENPSTAAQTSKSQRQPQKSRKQKNPMQKEKRFWREVKHLQNRCDNIIPRLPFSRVIREVMMDASREVTQITPTALEAIQAATEMYLTQRLQDAYMLTLHRGRVTLDVRDMELINYLKMNL